MEIQSNTYIIMHNFKIILLISISKFGEQYKYLTNINEI